MTPNFAFGGNSAIEAVAALSNALNKGVKNAPNGQLSQSAISAMFQEYQDAQKPRMKKIFDTCYYATRMQAWDNGVFWFIANYLAPWLGDERVADYTAMLVKGGVELDYLPVPDHPQGTCAWDNKRSAQKSWLSSMPWSWPRPTRLSTAA